MESGVERLREGSWQKFWALFPTGSLISVNYLLLINEYISLFRSKFNSFVHK